MSEPFQRLLRLTDAVARRLPETASFTAFAADTDLHERTLAVFAEQGVRVDEATVKAAADDLDRQVTGVDLQAPIVPLPVPAIAVRTRWWGRHSHSCTTVRYDTWSEAFDRVRQERIATHTGQSFIAEPVNDAHAQALMACWGEGVGPGTPIPYRLNLAKETGLFPPGKTLCPALQAVRVGLNFFASAEKLALTDVGLLNFLIQHDPQAASRHHGWKDWQFSAKTMYRQRAVMSVWDMMAHQLRTLLLEATAARWTRPRSWQMSALWLVLIKPLKHPQLPFHTDVQSWATARWHAQLEATVRYVLAHEENSVDYHAQVIREAIALGHGHRRWLKQWLPEYARAAGKVSE